MSEKTSPETLAEHVVGNMDYGEMRQSAENGLVEFYRNNPEKFEEDLINEGFKDGEETDQ